MKEIGTTQEKTLIEANNILATLIELLLAGTVETSGVAIHLLTTELGLSSYRFK